MPPTLSGDHALTLFRRLEAATSRLEDMVPNIADTSTSSNGVQLGSDEGLVAAELRGHGNANGSGSRRQLEVLPPMIDDFDGTINGEVKTFVNMSEEIGGLVAEQVRCVSPQVMIRN